MRLLFLILLTLTGAAEATGTLFDRRQLTLKAVDAHAKAHPLHLQQCSDPGGEWKTDVLAFPASSAARLYIFSNGTARGYQITGGVAHLVWCARFVNVPSDAWTYSTPVERALIFPLRTFAGSLPREGALDVFQSFAGTLTTRKLNSAGRVTCERTHDTGNLRSAFQFTPIDTCP